MMPARKSNSPKENTGPQNCSDGSIHCRAVKVAGAALFTVAHDDGLDSRIAANFRAVSRGGSPQPTQQYDIHRAANGGAVESAIVSGISLQDK